MNIESEWSDRDGAGHMSPRKGAELGIRAEIYCPVERQVSGRGRILHKVNAAVPNFSNAGFEYSDAAARLRKHREMALSGIERAVSAGGAWCKDLDARKQLA
jgi:hypothetical protein